MSVSSWFLSKLPVRDWTVRELGVVVLTVLLVACLPLSLSDAEWLKVNSVLWWAAAWGLGWGLLLTLVARRPVVVVFLMIAGGVLFIVQFQSQMLPPLEPALRELALVARWLVSWVIRIWSAIVFYPAGETALPPVSPALPEWRAAGERLLLYGWNLQADWPLTLAPHRWESGQILLGSILGLLVWMAAVWLVWSLVQRHSVWGGLATVPGLVALNVYYTEQGWGFFVFSVLAGLLLAGNTSLSRLRERHRAASFHPDLAMEWWTWSGILVMLVGVGMVLTIEGTDPEFIQQVNDFFTRPKTTSAGKGTNHGDSQTEEDAHLGVWPRQHLLEGSPDLNEQLVMSVRTPDVPPTHFYWRASSYDEYTGQGWIRNTATIMVSGDVSPWPDSPTPPPNFALLRQSYRLETPSHQIYAAGRPVRLNQPVEGLWSDVGGNDLIGLNSVVAHSAYEVLSWVPVATHDELREASEDYPVWIEESYLALPEGLPDRVVALAQEIAADAPTAYDKALALQSHLRTYEYTLDLPAPPDDRDVVDYFLFDLEKGYCDYYASAMVVMARSVGLPARLAVGYGTGEYDPEFEVYRVTRGNSHSWVEIYFPDFGWITFEPTAAFPEVSHGPTSDWADWAETSFLDEPAVFEEMASTPSGIGGEKLWLLAAIPATVGVIVGGVALASAIRGWKRRKSAPEQIVASLYADLLGQGYRLGVPHSDSQTPYEFLSALLGELTTRAKNAPRWAGDWDARLEQTDQAVRELITLYVDGCYSPRQPTRVMAEEVLNAWPKLRQALWAFWLAGNRTRSGSFSPKAG